VKSTRWFSLAVAAALLAGNAAVADTAKKGSKDESSFGALRSPGEAEARKLADAWLKAAAADAATLAKVKKVWDGEGATLDKVTQTLALGDAEAARLLKDANDEKAPAPTALPAALKDAKRPAFYRANLALAYGKALTLKKVYEEGLEALSAAKAEDVSDPAAYLFHKAVCEHALMAKDRADRSIDRLLVDVSDAPERYRMVASLMHFDMLTWREKDLGWVARKMDNVQRRLDLQRGGKHTQKIQKEVLVRLDEMIKELENQQKQQGGGGDNDGNCPPGNQPGNGSAPGNSPQSSNPQQDTQGGTASGSGEAEKKRMKEIADVWGKLPEKEREKVMQELRQRLPAKDRAIMDAYIAEMKKRSAK
jgi:hypothetical protein